MPHRPLSSPDPGSFAGRVLSFADSVVVEGRPFPASDTVFSGSDEFAYEACSDTPPFVPLEDLECSDPLAYAPFPGPSTFFVRVTERTPSAGTMREAQAAVLPLPMKAIPPEDREGWLLEVRKEAIRRTSPRFKFVSGLFFDGRVLLSCRTVESSLVRFLSSWFGSELLVDPVVWPRTSDSSLLLNVLDEELERRKTASREDFSMEEVRVTVGASSIHGPLKRNWTAIQSLFASAQGVEPVVDSAILSVSSKVGVSKLSVDELGLFRVKIPAGSGGLPRDRALRLLRTFDEVSSEARKELRAAGARALP